MDGILQTMQDCYDLLPVPTLIAERDGTGRWRAAYRNPIARDMIADYENGLLATMAEVLDGARTSDAVTVWHGEYGGRHWASRIAPDPRGFCILQIIDETRQLHQAQAKIDAANTALQSALDSANAASTAKSSFLANMSHDIRTPLNAIIGMTTIALAHTDDMERVKDCLDKISLSSKHLLSLVNDVLDVSRIESGHMTINPEDIVMADFIHDLMAMLRPQAEKKGQHLNLDFSGISHERVRGDALRLQQILINILGNAVKFTPEDGTITMRVRETQQMNKAEKSYAYYEFEIQDTGIGMKPEFLKKIFLPFERADDVERFEGTGLGMTITHSLVSMMNGEIAVQSTEGVGTTFTVTIPMELVLQEEKELEELRGRRVLAADADETSRKNLQEILTDLGMEADICSDAWSAMDKAAQARLQGQEYFAVLLNWHLPAVDGVQACKELRSILDSNVPILLMSTYEWTMNPDDMRKNGISAFIPKPLFRSKLGEMLLEYTPSARARKKPTGAEEESFAGHTVLLAEDNELNQEIAVELIEMLGAEAQCADNGREALDRFAAEPPGTFDLIFMDIQMPEMNGYEATRAIRALPRQDARTIPIIAMSANAFVEDIRACERAGMNAHVPKPVSLAQLEEVMERFLGSSAQGK